MQEFETAAAFQPIHSSTHFTEHVSQEKIGNAFKKEH
jgi:hypothetical protein